MGKRYNSPHSVFIALWTGQEGVRSRKGEELGNHIGGWFTDIWATQDNGFDYSGMGIERERWTQDIF